MISMRHSLAATLLLLLTAGVGSAAIRLASPFGEHMVLQQGVPVRIWGSGCPGGDNVSVSIAGQTAIATSDWAGRWMVRLAPMKAGGPYQMLVTIGGTGPHVPSPAATSRGGVELNDVLIGEVWLAAGQSDAPVGGLVVAGAEIPEARLPWIRMFKIPPRLAEEPQSETPGQWVITSPDTVSDYSARAFSFARELYDKLKVPIGVIDVSHGNSSPEAWTSRGHGPATLYNGMIAPLVPYAIRGVIWRPGAPGVSSDPPYRTLLETLIGDWRQVWTQGDFPFICESGDGTVLRDAQLQDLSAANTAMAVTIDLSEADRARASGELEAGRRLGLVARALAYGEPVPYSGPTYESMTLENSAIRLRFKNAEGGLESRGGTPTGFEIAGADKQFIRADAEIDGDTVVVRSRNVSKPLAVRYGYIEKPSVNLYNRAGLPASPFRTDR